MLWDTAGDYGILLGGVTLTDDNDINLLRDAPSRWIMAHLVGRRDGSASERVVVVWGLRFRR